MDAKIRRKHIHNLTEAARQLELAHACIGILEGMNGATPKRCVKQLKHYAQLALDRMDASAAKLGAPYAA